jgi:hypothetical protein
LLVQVVRVFLDIDHSYNVFIKESLSLSKNLDFYKFKFNCCHPIIFPIFINIKKIKLNFIF